MTKIYLVKVRSEKNGVRYTINSEAFTNRKKAIIYCEYCNLRVEKGESSLLREYQNIKYEVETIRICQLDWSEELNELQMKNLPY